MDWNERLQQIIDYVEEHLQRDEEAIDQAEITRIAGCSTTFFQKVFSYMNGISFAEYVRCRKLTLAGYDLKSRPMKVVEISYKYGYDSPTSFTKAFQQFHGVTPKQAKEADVTLRVYPKMQVVKQEHVTWNVIHKKEIRLLGKLVTLSQTNKSSTIPGFWHTCQMDGSFAQLIQLNTEEPTGIFGMFDECHSDKTMLTYGLMVASDQPCGDGFVEVILPEVAWAIFEFRGPIPQTIQNGWKYLLEEWLVKYPFRHAPCPELEFYSNGNVYDENYQSQIWIPIIEEE